MVEQYDSTHPLIHKKVHWLHGQHLRGEDFVGVLGNENADRLATADVLDASNAEVPFWDWYPIIQSRVNHKWKDDWLAIGTNKLRSLKSSIDVWPSSCDRDRKISCILTRLRIGHTILTQHLMENRPPPYCTDCLVPLKLPRDYLRGKIIAFSRLSRHFDLECATLSYWGAPPLRVRCTDDALWESWRDLWSSLAYAISAGNGNDWLHLVIIFLPDVLWLSCVWRDIARSEVSRTTPPITYLWSLDVNKGYVNGGGVTCLAHLEPFCCSK